MTNLLNNCALEVNNALATVEALQFKVEAIDEQLDVLHHGLCTLKGELYNLDMLNKDQK